MSKIYNEYLRLKAEDSNKLYLFKSGKFYIFVGDDCDIINNYVVLKKTKFSNESDKCGFPENVLNDYLRVFKNHNLDIEVINDVSLNKDNLLYNYIENIDINTITPLESLNYLKKIKELINNEEQS